MLTRIHSESIPPFACKVFSNISSWSSVKVLKTLWTFRLNSFTSWFCSLSLGSFENLKIFLIIQHFLLYIYTEFFQSLFMRFSFFWELQIVVSLSIRFFNVETNKTPASFHLKCLVFSSPQNCVLKYDFSAYLIGRFWSRDV